MSALRFRNLSSLFLGPKGENAHFFENLLLEAFRDHVFWRRNFHPEDGFLVQEADRRRPEYEASQAVLSQELMSLLAELKAGVPFFSPRYIGHMTSDLTMASLIGYFATMLYNPNNVSADASPVTTRLELDVAAQLARMVGYPAERQWGHLTSGGTLANFESLWVARNIKYLPVAVHAAANEAGLRGLTVTLPSGRRADLQELDLWQLLNVEPGAALDLVDAFRARVGDGARAAQLIDRHSLAGLGSQEFGRVLAKDFGDALESAVVLVPSTAHYSWEKVCRALGVGGAQLVHVPVDSRFRMSADALQQRLESLAARRQPVLACVSVIGTTEESAVDRLDQVASVREWAGRELGLAFHLHADAAWGGYAAAITRAPDGRRHSYEEVVAGAAPEVWPEEGVYRALCALERTDSVTLDPHKLGYMPYPAGAICFRDKRVRELVSVDAPYVFHTGDNEGANIGRFILEGSKPGAAAAGVWMSHKVLPLDSEGYGRLITETAKGARALHRRLAGGDFLPFRLVLLPASDINIVCFAVGHPSLKTLEDNNAFVHRVYLAMSGSAKGAARRPDYYLTKTVLRRDQYGHAPDPLVQELGFTAQDYLRVGGLAVLRCTVMDPFLASPQGKVEHLKGFAETLRRVMESELRGEVS
ncbi:group II decarboxylase family protein [Labilithrix luteola]|uniref:Group II decarboxylase family protein n=1 Tax=Labilithrix luteola TaxID=1391654 RepID=A0A0K1PWB2_9BACT|nr:pyridoxal-dependent decarboxylase [Labilithrix luteola]AKU97810.1 group II decarboxylase family protein [Labilithrix luteola]